MTRTNDSNEGWRCEDCGRIYGPTNSCDPCPYCEFKHTQDMLRRLCRDFACELDELQAGRLTSFKTLLIRIQRIASGHEN